jgi:hypothetical protein
MFTPHKLPWGTTIDQKWIFMFNPNFSSSLKLPIWIILKMLPLEFRPLDTKIASLIGRVFGVDVTNKSKKDPKFYVAMDLEKGWLAQLFFVGFSVEICVDYERYPIRCHFFMGFSHRIKDYPSLTT